MTIKTAFAWGAVIIGVALLDFFAVIPTGTAEVAVLSLPVLAAVSSKSCVRGTA